jgi:hypothetical protein
MPRLRAMLVLAAIAMPAAARAGGSEWRNLAPYSDDVAKVMEQLKREVLRSGNYYKRNPKRKPRSPEQALQMNGEDGTHSIMDMAKVSLVEAGRFKCEVATVCPVPKADLVKLFGSDRPTRAMVETYDKRLALATFQSSWSAVWIKVYEGATPKWLYFAGVSSD